MIQSLTRLAVAAALAAALPTAFARAQEAETTVAEQTPTPMAVTVPVRTMGDPAAPVQIDIYASFVCEPCARFHTAVLPGLVRDYVDPGQAKVVFHDVITSPAEDSARAAAIGLCAAPERFFAVADSFMRGLAGAMTDAAGPWYEAAIAASGRTEEDMAACSVAETTYNQLVVQLEQASALGLENFPVVRVNGQFVADPTDGAVRMAIMTAPPAPEAAPPAEPERASAD